MYYIYMLRCEDGSVYTGITTDISRRFMEHSGTDKGAKYTRSHKPEKIIALWKCEDRSAASKLEYRIKHLEKKHKERLASSGDLNVFGSAIDGEKYERAVLEEI